MAELIVLSKEEAKKARAYEASFRAIVVDPSNQPASLAEQLSPHLEDTLHVFTSNTEGTWQNGLVARISTKKEVENGVPVQDAVPPIANQLIERGAVAIVFHRDMDLFSPEFHSNNGS